MIFREEYYYLSNMFPCDVTVDIDGKPYTFTCVEAAFQAHKCPEKASEFTDINGFAAKKKGRRVPLRSDWEDVKDDVMYKCLKAKFSNPELKEKLLSITEPIVEDNTWRDTYWGMYNGKGQNKLGKLLEKVKSES